ncbi:putative O-glycosylation ligase, exosortase A system-associated [Azohydromonas caseinilytica]|uniref:Putative O-glycosylation ligase, exosortase A system-associated n=1 Tax=Azohydromonas caseinilytica TaxID=2728836 RepID=A0A848F7U3_9BURK|nr:putative O-glycosylation ligase, exosortase A system-associated [Azohydromonas caseinilytica]NML14413.1 putative O-glycosylation ligase, exosortase A system-associated [Azohydromonas caseinilytica]
MRDLLVVLPVVIGCLLALRQPWIGVLVWTWLSIMNPHRLTYGFAYSAPLAAMAAGTTLLGLLFTRERGWPFKGPPVVWLALLMLWLNLSWIFAQDRAGDQEVWSKVMKIDFMILVALAVMHSKRHIMGLAWVVAMSLAVLGTKGGIFTILTGGSYRTVGPAGSFLDDNNQFALALIITIPVLRFLQLQVTWRRGRQILGLMMLLCALAALGSQSRGALLALGAMVLAMWWRGNSRVLGGVFIAVAAVAMVAFMPDSWTERMNTIQTYEEDASAQGRISAWHMAWNAAQDHLFGLGYITWKPEYFERYSPFPKAVFAAHSIYFQMMGSHGFIGLAIFLSLWISTWFTAGWLRKHAAGIEEARWAADLGNLVQMALLGYAVGGAFLSLAYFDLPYNLMVLVVLARVWVATRAWEREPPPKPPFWKRKKGGPQEIQTRTG